MLSSLIKFFLDNKLVAYLLLLLFVGWGLVTAPFDFGLPLLPRDAVPVDAIPDVGENQQIVFTKWAGRSPQDVEDQITYPLTTALLGIPGVKSVRSNSMFGFSSIYVIFNDKVEFYWSRSRILEKLNSLPQNTLPEGVQPGLGPDATALGQIFWYTLEGRDEKGNTTGGWDLHELRSIQDFYVRYGLSAAEGVAEVASVGGFVKEYQVDVDPESLKNYKLSLEQVMNAIRQCNLDIGAQTMEVNRVEYFVRGLGYVKDLQDIEKSVIVARDNIAITVGDVASVNIGPANRRGVLDKSGAEVVGGVVVARYGANPLAVIDNVKKKIAEIEPGLPSKVLEDGTSSQIKIVPFYDRTQLINETIGTLEEALSLEILITVIVIILMLLNLKSSLLVAGTLPVAVLMCFIAMRYLQVDANIVALSGIAIAIGTMVDMGIVLMESIVNRLEEAPPEESVMTSVFEATMEVASAVITAVATTVISFLPVFTMEAAEGKLFRPLAYTKTFALLAAIVVSLVIIPPLAHSLFSLQSRRRLPNLILNGLAMLMGGGIVIWGAVWAGGVLMLMGAAGIGRQFLLQSTGEEKSAIYATIVNIIYALVVAWFLAEIWMPLGGGHSNFDNFLFIILIAGFLIAIFLLVIRFYEVILHFLLKFKILFLLLVGIIVYLGFNVFRETGEEFMPALDEGAFLLMPTSMPHAGMEENIKNLRMLDMSVTSIPEVETVVGKAGRVNSALDPAPMSMYENVILYKPEYKLDEQGRRLRFRYENGAYTRTKEGGLIPDPNGRYYRQWRDHIKSSDDIWQEITQVAKLPGLTSAPKLQPIETRLVMLQTGMRAPMGIKVRGPDLETIESFGLLLEQQLKEVEGVKEAAVFADRIVGKPYLLLDIQRDVISRYGLTIEAVQQAIQAAVGGMVMTKTVEGRERYAIRVRYPRELRNTPEALEDIYVRGGEGQQIPLGKLVKIRYEQGAQSIKSEDGFLIGYVLFDKEGSFSEVEVVNNAKAFLESQIKAGHLEVPAGISYRFAGNYEQQQRASERLRLVLPISLVLIFLILYFQFRSTVVALMVFTGVFIAFSGGFLMIGLYDTNWFLDFTLFDVNMRDLFQVQTINLSVAVWVGFLALFGIATDDGVLVATFLQDSFRKNKPTTIPEIRAAVVKGGLRRVRPAMMTTATTILALLPVLTATGRGADIMIPMALPSFGGMSLQIITMFTVPVLYSLWQEWKWRLRKQSPFGKKIVLSLLLLSLGGSSVFSQSLNQLLEQAGFHNREIQARSALQQAAMERVGQTGILADPELGIGVFTLPVETRLGPQRARLGVTQAFPWPGTLNVQQQLAREKAVVKNYDILTYELELAYQIKQLYWQLVGIQEKQKVLGDKLKLLHSMEQIALARVENGSASSTEILRIQLQINEREQEIRLLELEKVAPSSSIHQLLGDSSDHIITPAINKLEIATLPSSEEAINNQLIEHPFVQSLEQQKMVAEQEIKLNQLNAMPSFGLGADYIIVGKRQDADPAKNGRDILQLRAGVKMPLNKDAYSAKEREEQAKIRALDYRKENLQSVLKARLETAFVKYEQALLKCKLYDDQIGQTAVILKIEQSRYSVGEIPLEELLRTEKAILEYQLKWIEASVQSHLAKAEIEFYKI